MVNNKVKRFICALIVTMVILLVTMHFAFDKKDIHKCTAEDLMEINGLGVTKSVLIVEYLELNEDADIDDLACINGIGDVTIKRIKEVYGD